MLTTTNQTTPRPATMVTLALRVGDHLNCIHPHEGSNYDGVIVAFLPDGIVFQFDECEHLTAKNDQMRCFVPWHDVGLPSDGEYQMHVESNGEQPEVDAEAA